ncbi:predicted protein [Histoplasma capsulatum G186AR]|uniref:Uncharacterized protein n=1 Tax=Ajellomyces capsulatus (strain G186AR / H82 / ATCC MYA-2454 / RMSCC 2432) TaxID=447093 RepID=C0NEQ0_AJECG|nr:uncharacterized protein HCBG_01366 [Histoplasma capsulatum G186AR]EEH09721.1 predicted protein [Histoplasma capsulatum G186AR]
MAQLAEPDFRIRYIQSEKWLRMMVSMWKPRCHRGHARITFVKWRNLSARFTEPQVRYGAAPAMASMPRWAGDTAELCTGHCGHGQRISARLTARTWNCFQGFSGDFVLPPSVLIHVALVIRVLLVRPYGVGLGYSEETLSCYLVKRGKRNTFSLLQHHGWAEREPQPLNLRGWLHCPRMDSIVVNSS